MRPIGFAVVGFVYLMSLSLFMVETMILHPAGIVTEGFTGAIDVSPLIEGTEVEEFKGAATSALSPKDSGGTILDRVSTFFQGGYSAVWTLLGLLSGTYIFTVLGAIGIPAIFIGVIQAVFGLIVAHTVVSFVAGRG